LDKFILSNKHSPTCLRNKQQLINLQKFEFDVFQPTAKSIDDKEFKIDGLISLDDINKLVENRYKVVIKSALVYIKIYFELPCIILLI
jgi:hypothetical protein